MTETPVRKTIFYVFTAFWIVGAALGIAAVLKKKSLSEATLRFGGLAFFGLFFVAMSLAEIFSGEIRTRISGPAMCTKEDHPIRFWTLVGSQLLVGTVLLGFSFVRS
jgi:hypothetical protein